MPACRCFLYLLLRHDSPTSLGCEGFARTNRPRFTSEQPGTKSASCPGGKTRMNWLCTASFVPPSVYMFFFGVCAFTKTSRTFVHSWTGKTLLGSIPRLSDMEHAATRCPADICPTCVPGPAPLAPSPPCPARWMFGFWTRQIAVPPFALSSLFWCCLVKLAALCSSKLP